MHRPLIGITTYVEQARFSVYDTQVAVLPWSYVEQVRAAGGRPMLIPPCPDGGVEALEGVDGLVIAGGHDVEPAYYGEQPHAKTYSSEVRDAGELPLIRQALRTGLPLLGVCRGMQAMAVVGGGRLYQHLPDVLGHNLHRVPGEEKHYSEHGVRFLEGSRGYEMFGSTTRVNSYHHQGVADPGIFVPTGWCIEDELVESIEHPDHPFAIGVQWHPEDMAPPTLFCALVNAAVQSRTHRSSLVTV